MTAADVSDDDVAAAAAVVVAVAAAAAEVDFGFFCERTTDARASCSCW